MGYKDEIRYNKGVILVLLLIICLLFIYTEWNTNHLESMLLELEGRIDILEGRRVFK